MNATVDFGQLGFNHAVKARDLWQQKDLDQLSTPSTRRGSRATEFYSSASLNNAIPSIPEPF